MIDANIEDRDLLVIDRSIETRNGKIAVCMIDGKFTMKRLKVEENELIIWGIVTYVIKEV